MEEENLLVEDEGRVIEVDLTAESFLTMAAPPQSAVDITRLALPEPVRVVDQFSRMPVSTPVSCSRSRNCQLPAPDLAEIRVTAPDQGKENVAALLGRPVSFHFCETSIYEKTPEHRRSALHRPTRPSAAGSRHETEYRHRLPSLRHNRARSSRPLNELGRGRHRVFATDLKRSTKREENGQFCGLIVKNLEKRGKATSAT